MITLKGTSDKLRGYASNANRVSYSLFGAADISSTLDPKILAAGQLAATEGDLLVPAAAADTFTVRLLVLTNEHTSGSETVNLMVRTGATSYRVLPKDLVLPAGWTLYVFGPQVFTMVDPAGRVNPGDRMLPVGIGLNELRLTLTSGTPVTTSDVTAAGTVYLENYVGNRIGLYYSGQWQVFSTGQRSVSLTGLAASTLHYVYAYWDGDSVELEVSTTGTVATDGIEHKSGDQTKRLVGLLYTTGTGTTEDSASNRYLCNWSNQVPKPVRAHDTENSWTYATASWRRIRGAAASAGVNQASWVACGRRPMVADYLASLIAGASSTYGSVGLAVDWSSGSPSSDSRWGISGQNATGYDTVSAHIRTVAARGRHTVDLLEYAWAGTVTFYGDAGSPGDLRPGMLGEVWV